MKSYNIIYQIKGTNKTYSKVYQADDDITARSMLTTDIIAGNIEEIKDLKDLHIISSNKI